MFRTMAGARDDAPLMRAHVDAVAVLYSHIAARQGENHHAEPAPALALLPLDRRLVPARGARLPERLVRDGFARVVHDHPGGEHFAARHPQLHAMLLRDPAGKSDMVG